jgi:hypothetical protein
MFHFRALHFGAKHFAAVHLRGLVGGGNDTHDLGYGYYYDWWKKQHAKKQKPPTLEEVIEAVQENPVEALKAVPQARKQFQGIDYSKVAQNTEMAMFIAKQLLITIELRRLEEEEDENASIMLLLM